MVMGMRSRAGSTDSAVTKKSNASSVNNSKSQANQVKTHKKTNSASTTNTSKSSPSRNNKKKDHRGRPLPEQHHRRRSLSPLACIVPRPGTPGSMSRCKTPSSTAAIHPNSSDADRYRNRSDVSVGSSLSVRDQFDIYLPQILPSSRSQKNNSTALPTGVANKSSMATADDDISSITTNEYLKHGGLLTQISHWTSCACTEPCRGSTTVVDEEEEEALPSKEQVPLVETKPVAPLVVYQPKKQPILRGNSSNSKNAMNQAPADSKAVPSPLPASDQAEEEPPAPPAIISCLPFDLCNMSSSANKPDESATVDTTKGSHDTSTSHEDVALARNASLFDDALDEDETKQKRKWRLSLPWNRKQAGGSPSVGGGSSPASSPSRINRYGKPPSPARSKGKKQ